MRKLFGVVLAAPIISSFLMLSASASHPLSPIIGTASGKVQGVDRDGYLQFKGVPYAEPPVGERRWTAPKERKWETVIRADHFGNSCATALNLAGFSKTSSSEDCLYLNIYTPREMKGKKYPVLFWIPGGGLQTGSADEYDASNFVKKNVVVVTVNYRVGVFGFFSLPGNSGKANSHANFGLLDQQAALRWVKTNIRRFGGDEENITIAGESAGGYSVLANIFSPLSQGLFKNAIASSGAYHADFRSIGESNEVGNLIAARLGCAGDEVKVRDCLMKMPAESFLDPKIFTLRDDGFIIDGQSLKKTFNEYLADGDYNKVNLINGFNSDEGTFFAGVMEIMKGGKLNRQDYLDRLRVLYGRNTEKDVLSTVNVDKVDDFTQQLSHDVGKFKFVCPAIRFNNSFSRNGVLYSYEFADRTAPQYIAPMSLPYGASHTGELAYLFKNFHGATGSVNKLNPSQKKLSEKMLGYWISFIKTGNPNSRTSSSENWSAYSVDQQKAMLFEKDSPRSIDRLSERWNCP